MKGTYFITYGIICIHKKANTKRFHLSNGTSSSQEMPRIQIRKYCNRIENIFHFKKHNFRITSLLSFLRNNEIGMIIIYTIYTWFDKMKDNTKQYSKETITINLKVCHYIIVRHYHIFQNFDLLP